MDTPVEKLTFTTIDYVLFCGMLALSTLIGVYYGFIAKQKQNTTAEYLLGSKKMSIWPVAISLTATHISATTLLGVPAEIYKYGTQYWVCAISGIVMTWALCSIYLPVMHGLQTISCYAYLERRFNKNIRSLASFMYIFYVVILTPLFAYTPALAFSQVTGINLHIITPVICCVCIFYTTFGGIRAVVWTDTLQFSAMVLAVIIVMVLGTLEVGGIVNVFKIAEHGNRLVWFNMDPDPMLRSSFWMVSVGLTLMWVSNIAASPEAVQRFVAIKKLSDAKNAAWAFGIGHVIVKLFSVYNGLLIFSKYSECDPLFNGDIRKHDQIFPYYVMDVARSIPGLPGLFIVGALSAALSTMSTCLNSLSGTMYEDFIKPMYPDITEKKASNILKLLVLSIGSICLALVFVVEKLGGVFSIGIAFSGITSGPLLALFTLGMVSYKFNTKGALWGSVISIFIVSFIAIGAQIRIAEGLLKYPSLPFNVEECDRFNQTLLYQVSPANSTTFITDVNADNSNVHWIFRIGFMYYSLLGALIVLVVGYPISIFTGGTKNLDEKLLAPFLRKSYRKNVKLNQEAKLKININDREMETLQKS